MILCQSLDKTFVLLIANTISSLSEAIFPRCKTSTVLDIKLEVSLESIIYFEPVLFLLELCQPCMQRKLSTMHAEEADNHSCRGSCNHACRGSCQPCMQRKLPTMHAEEAANHACRGSCQPCMQWKLPTMHAVEAANHACRGSCQPCM